MCRQRIVPKLRVPAQVNAPLDDEPALLFSGRTLHFRKFNMPREEGVCVDEQGLIPWAYVKRPGLAPHDVMYRTDQWLSLHDLPRLEPQTRLVERLWDLIKWNEESLIEDSAQMKLNCPPRPEGPWHVIEEENVQVAEGVKLQPGVVLDGSKGPVVVDRGASIGANAVLQGPCYVGPHAQVQPLAHVRPGTSIGTMCKVGGEISNSILFGYSNKPHGGYLGDSYIGKWVNLGAGTTTSNLKNTYGEISVTGPEGDVKTGRRNLGSLIGDHVKTAIGSRLMAGTYVGFAAMLAGSDIVPKFNPSFTYWTDKRVEPYRLDKAIDVMKAVFSRRDRMWEPTDESIVRYVAQVAASVEQPAR
jgi:UDP-N-acetylglucosamine diphosphorylase/glucosamine-1-phosphate N-acetyltransferase